jgi:hypothetical protein
VREGLHGYSAWILSCCGSWAYCGILTRARGSQRYRVQGVHEIKGAVCQCMAVEAPNCLSTASVKFHRACYLGEDRAAESCNLHCFITCVSSFFDESCGRVFGRRLLALRRLRARKCNRSARKLGPARFNRQMSASLGAISAQRDIPSSIQTRSGHGNRHLHDEHRRTPGRWSSDPYALKF